MKKFYSTLAIAAIALTSVFGFTSCDKEYDDDFDNAPRQSRIEVHTETFGYDNHYTTNTTRTTDTGTIETTTTNVSENDTKDEPAAEVNAQTNEARRRRPVAAR